MQPSARDEAIRCDAAVSAARNPGAKLQHIDACLSSTVEYCKSTGFESVEFANQALPEVSLDQLDISTCLANKRLKAPLMIAPMTGGTERGFEINRLLARAAEYWQIPMGVGSQRIAIEDPMRARYFSIRDQAPTALLFANLGGAQLVKGWGAEQARRAVEMIEADALFIHLNPIQEAIQGGDQDFRGLGEHIRRLCEGLRRDGIPVFVREVCFGMSPEASRRLIDCGVAGLDCAGAGGTSWAKVEALCAKTERRRKMGQLFGEWGIPTSRSIRNVRSVSDDIPLIATGGLRNGIDLAKALALGADVGAMARPFLLKAHEGEEALHAFIADTLTELRICMFGAGAACLRNLRGCAMLSQIPLRS
jgi:isopentenyl-diphosphate delta-isomerase